jgi:hypothetical protein
MTRLDIAAPVHRYIDVDGVRVYQLRPGPGLSDGVCNGPDLKVRDHRECPPSTPSKLRHLITAWVGSADERSPRLVEGHGLWRPLRARSVGFRRLAK